MHTKIESSAYLCPYTRLGRTCTLTFIDGMGLVGALCLHCIAAQTKVRNLVLPTMPSREQENLPLGLRCTSTRRMLRVRCRRHTRPYSKPSCWGCHSTTKVSIPLEAKRGSHRKRTESTSHLRASTPPSGKGIEVQLPIHPQPECSEATNSTITSRACVCVCACGQRATLRTNSKIGKGANVPC